MQSIDPHASVQFRVCDLHFLSSLKGDAYSLDGLYVVLRLGDQVRRTSCLWGVRDDYLDPNIPLQDAAALAAYDAECCMWNDLFVFPLGDVNKPEYVSHTCVDTQKDGRLATTGITAGRRTGSDTVSPSLRPSSSLSPSPHLANNNSNASQHRQQQQQQGMTSGSGEINYLFPSVDVELWRSTPKAEAMIGRYAFSLPLELLNKKQSQAGDTAISAQNAPQLKSKGPESTPLIDRVVPLHGASSYDVKLGLRVRVQAIGVSCPLVDMGGSLSAPLLSLAMGNSGTQSQGFMSSPNSAHISSGSNDANNRIASVGGLLGNAVLPHYRSGLSYTPSVLGSMDSIPFHSGNVTTGAGISPYLASALGPMGLQGTLLRNGTHVLPSPVGAPVFHMPPAETGSSQGVLQSPSGPGQVPQSSPVFSQYNAYR